MAVYTNDLRLKEIATGDESGTWGTSTNTNLSLVAEAFSFGTEAITTNADTHTTTIADGSTDPGRSLFLKYTGTLDSACTITIGPNTVSKLWLIENATSGSQNIIIKQGSGATVTIANGQTKAIYSDGAGSGGAMVDAFQDLSIPDLFIDDDLTFTSDSAVITFGADGDTTLTHTDGSGLTLNSTNKLMFNDASQFIQGSSATVLSLGATDEIDLTATAIDVNGTMDVSGAVTANAGISIDNITIDGTEIDLSSGDLTIDVAGDIIFDADGGDFRFKDAGTQQFILDLDDSANSVILRSSTSDGDMIFQGNDGGSNITALTLDMSEAGAAAFNAGATFASNVTISTADNSTTLNLVSTDTDANAGPHLRLSRNVTGADNDALGQVEFAGRDDAGNDFLFAQIEAYIVDASNGSEDGYLEIFRGVGGTERVSAMILSPTDTVFNENSGDIDFRVESNGNTHMLFVDGGNDAVGIGVSDVADAQLVIRSTGVDGTYNNVLSAQYSGNSNEHNVIGTSVSSTAANSGFIFKASDGGGSTGTTEVLKLTRAGAIFNDASGDQDFRVESDGNTHMLFVDAGNNAVGIGVSDPGGLPLHLKVASGDNKLRMETANKDAFVMELKDASGDLHLGTNTTAGALVIADAGKVGIGISSPDAEADALHVVSSGTNTVQIDGTGSHELYSYHDSGGVGWATGADSSYGELLYLDEGSSRVIIYAAGNTTTFFTDAATVVNDGSRDHDFRVEGDNQANLIFANAGNDCVGIGTNAPTHRLEVRQDVAASSDLDNSHLFLFNGSDGGAGIEFGNGVSASSKISFGVEGTGASTDETFLGFSTGANGAMSERLRITSSGIVTMGSSSHNDDVLYLTRGNSGKTLRIFEGSTEVGFIGTDTTTGLAFNNLFTANASIGTFLNQLASSAGNADVRYTTSTGAVTFDTSSRLVKENIEDIPYGLEAIKKLSPKKYKRTDGEKDVELGLIADEVVEVIPEIVGIMSKSVFTKEESDTEEIPGSVRYSKLTAVLVKAIQEQQDMIETLQTKVAALEGGS